jgi:hypothetical protein
MTIETLDFTGNGVTILGFVGVISTAIILVSAYRSYWKSPYRNSDLMAASGGVMVVSYAATQTLKNRKV